MAEETLDVMDDPIEDDDDFMDEYEDTFESDTAMCGLCGRYYCTCCGCDCWWSDDEDEEDNYEDDVEETE